MSFDLAALLILIRFKNSRSSVIFLFLEMIWWLCTLTYVMQNYMSERALYKWFFYYPVKKTPTDKRFICLIMFSNSRYFYLCVYGDRDMKMGCSDFRTVLKNYFKWVKSIGLLLSDLTSCFHIFIVIGFF